MSTPDSGGTGRRLSETTLALVGAYFLLVTLYAWQAWRRETPTIFTDELELTQISRAISEVGHPERRGEPYGFTTLAPWITAPFWWISSVATAYEAIKYFQALVMALAIFPAFAIARTVVSPPVGAVRGDRDDRRAGVVVRADPRRGAVRVPHCGARPLVDRPCRSSTPARAPSAWPPPRVSSGC